jgi:ankyrin repeat protein
MSDNFDYSKESAPIVSAVMLCHFDKAVNLIQQGLDINARDDQGRNALIMAIEEDWAGLDWVHLLISSGIDVNMQDADGDTALDIAKYKKRTDIVECLLKHGATGKEGPSAKEIMSDEIYAAFEVANKIKLAGLKNK